MKFLSKAVLASYILILLWLVLFKFSLHFPEVFEYARSVNLIPFADYSRENPREMIYNFLVFIPFGVLLSVNFKQAKIRQNLAFIFFFSVALEIIQLIFAIGAGDITDIIMNTTGGLLGLALYGVNKRYFHNEKLDRSIAVGGMALLALLVGVLFSGHLNFRSAPSRNMILPQSAVLEDALIDWPKDGQAAVGTVEDGLLAHSSSREQPRPIASIAKIITALAIMEKQPFELGQQGPTFTISSEDITTMSEYLAEDGSALPLLIGTKLTQYQAMQRVLIASDNNVADILAERIFGSQEAYVSYANDMLRRMGLRQTTVTDASGFSSDTVSTPSELIIIGIAALKNPVIADIVSQSEAQVPPNNRTITNTNKLLNTNGVIGIKTGATDAAGNCLLFAARHTDSEGQEKTIVGVVLGSKNSESRFSDSSNLLASIKQSLDQAFSRADEP